MSGVFRPTDIVPIHKITHPLPRLSPASWGLNVYICKFTKSPISTQFQNKFALRMDVIRESSPEWPNGMRRKVMLMGEEESFYSGRGKLHGRGWRGLRGREGGRRRKRSFTIHLSKFFRSQINAVSPDSLGRFGQNLIAILQLPRFRPFLVSVIGATFHILSNLARQQKVGGKRDRNGDRGRAIDPVSAFTGFSG